MQVIVSKEYNLETIECVLEGNNEPWERLLSDETQLQIKIPGFYQDNIKLRNYCKNWNQSIENSTQFQWFYVFLSFLECTCPMISSHQWNPWRYIRSVRYQDLGNYWMQDVQVFKALRAWVCANNTKHQYQLARSYEFFQISAKELPCVFLAKENVTFYS